MELQKSTSEARPTAKEEFRKFDKALKGEESGFGYGNLRSSMASC